MRRYLPLPLILLAGCTPLTYQGRVKKFIRENPCHVVEHIPAGRRWDWVDVEWQNYPGGTRWRCDGVPESMLVDDVDGRPWTK